MGGQPASVPDRFQEEPVLAWRAWHVEYVLIPTRSFKYQSPTAGAPHDIVERRQEVRLVSPVRHVHWTPLVKFESECQWESHHFVSCRCGVYALRTAPGIWLQTPIVVGKVSLWGRVIECVKGYRAQYAYPYDLTLFMGDAALAREIGGVYGVDCKWSGLPGVKSSYDEEYIVPAPRVQSICEGMS